MDLAFVDTVRRPASRAELGDLGPDTALLAGGTWLYSEPQDHLRTLVDLTALAWEPLEVTDTGITVGATCTLAELAASGVPLAPQCCRALAGSFKIWNTATVGGNVCLALPAGPVTSLAAALDGVALIWTPTGERRMPVSRFVAGNRRTLLARGEVLRAVELPASALAARVAFRRAALSAEGRSGAVVIGRVDPDGLFVLTVTAAVERPHRFAFPRVPDAPELVRALDGVQRWFDDPHGAPDWRRAVTGVLAEQVREELA